MSRSSRVSWSGPGLPPLFLAAVLAVGCGKKQPAREKQPLATPSRKAVDAGLATKPKGPAPKSKSAPPLKNITVNGMFNSKPTFVVGTTGSDLDDHRIATQVALMRGIALPRSPMLRDTAIRAELGLKGWPRAPILYGRPDQNAALARIKDRLPFTITKDKLEIGPHTFTGPGYRIAVVIPAQGGSKGHPDLAVLAGTGDGGIAEINSSLPFGVPIVIADRFGARVLGKWKRGSDGRLEPVLSRPQPRGRFRATARELSTADGKTTVKVTVAFPEAVPPSPQDAAIVEACLRGLGRVVRKLRLQTLVPVTIYVYAGPRQKRSVTGNTASGHAVPSGYALHVIRADPKKGGALEGLLTHEGTHLLAYYAWNPSGTALMGEGLAVWVRGGYQGIPLPAWAKRLAKNPRNVPRLVHLLSPTWRRIPEAIKYPLSAIFVDIAMKKLGPAKVRQLLAVGAHAFRNELKAGGTTLEALQSALDKRLGLAK